MIGYFVNMTLAAIVAASSYYVKWWIPAIIFPMWILVARITPLSSDQITPTRVYVMRGYFYILVVINMVAQTIIFHLHMDSRFGWIIGLFIGWFVGGMIAGKLEPQLMHRELPR